jgi:predicted MPP superfamily phosphohydrolase
MNIIFLIVSVIVTFIIFGLPIWNLARLRNNRHPLWWIIPPFVFLCLFYLSNVLESQELVFWYKVVNQLSFYWLIIGLMLFGFSILSLCLKAVFRISNIRTFWLIIILTLGYTAVALVSGYRVVSTEVLIPAENIQRSYSFVHISDVHIGSTNKNHVQRIVDVISELNPEFVVITGDFIDEFYASNTDAMPFNDLSMPVYLITGNHEYYLEPGIVEEVIEGTKIQLIDRSKVSFEDLDIIGVNELDTIAGTLSVVGDVDPERYTILLDHQPLEEEAQYASAAGVSLMLSGHTHRGQIWPMEYLIKLRYFYVGGLYDIGDMFLYVNQGTGTLGPKMRIGTINEVTNIILEPQPNNEL